MRSKDNQPEFYEDCIYRFDFEEFKMKKLINAPTPFLKWYLNIQFVHDEMDTLLKDPIKIWRSRYNHVVNQYKQLLILGKYYDSNGKYHESYALGDPTNEFNWRHNLECNIHIFSLMKYDQEAIGNEMFDRKRLPQNYWYSSPQKTIHDQELKEWKEKITLVNDEYNKATVTCYGFGGFFEEIYYKIKKYNYRSIGSKRCDGRTKSFVLFPLPKNYWYTYSKGISMEEIKEVIPKREKIRKTITF